MIRTFVAISVFAASVFAQPRVSLENQGIHVLCVVPMIGSGTQADPARPMFAPLASAVVPPPPANATTQPPAGKTPVVIMPKAPIISMQYQLSDDGKLALVDFAGSSMAAVQPILNSTDPNVRVCLLRDTSTRTQIETAFQQYKASYSLNSTVPALAAATAAGKSVAK